VTVHFNFTSFFCLFFHCLNISLQVSRLNLYMFAVFNFSFIFCNLFFRSSSNPVIQFVHVRNSNDWTWWHPKRLT
jgi:hypothetical protein